MKTLNQGERSPLAVEDQVAVIYSATNGFVDRVNADRVPEFNEALVERQVVAIWVGTGGYLDVLPVEDAKRFVDEFIEHIAARTDVLDSIRNTGELSDEAEAALKQSLEDFRQTFVSSDAEAGSEARVGQGAPRDPVKPDVGRG